MERKPVKSSNVASVGYDAEAKTLEVEYKNGGVYTYHDVPQKKYDDLIAAESIGSHLHANIKGQHKYSKG